jgi:uncharacterized protein involved in exopolysaccharide biosynthesis
MNQLQRAEMPPPFYHDVAPAEPGMTALDLARVFWRRLWLVALILAVSTLTAAILSRRTPKAWRASAQVMLVQHTPIFTTSSQAMASAPVAESVDTQITLMQSRKVADLAAQRVGASADALLGSAVITPRHDGDNVIDVAVEADSRQRAVDWANALCRAFVGYKTGLAQTSSADLLATRRKQAAQARAQMEAADARLRAFQASHRLGGVEVIDTTAQKAALLKSYNDQSDVVRGYFTPTSGQ